jgi:AcrR family transcriptional regulator
VTAPATRPLRRDAAGNRRRLIEAAHTVFGRRGLDAGVDEVAAEAGVGVGTFYRHFGAKDALLDALVEAFMDDVERWAREALHLPDGLGLETYLWQLGEALLVHRACLPRLAASTAATRIDALRPVLDELIADARQHGRVRPDLTRGDVSMLTWGLRAVITTTGSIAPDAWRRHLELVLDGTRPGHTFQNAAMTDGQLAAAEEIRLRPGAAR